MTGVYTNCAIPRFGRTTMNRLRQLTYEPSKHNLETQFAMGRLMSPAEVAAATRHRPHHETECYEQRWMLCGDVKAATYELFSRTPAIAIPFRVSAFTSTPGDVLNNSNS